MENEIPQHSPAADTNDEIGTSLDASVAQDVNASDSGEPRQRQPRAKTPEETIRSLQSENDRVKSRFGALLSSDYAKSLGGEGIIRALDQLTAMLSHAETAKSVQEHLRLTPNGQWEYRPPAIDRASGVDSAAGVTGFEEDDPLVRQIEAKLDARITPLLERLNAIQTRSETALSASGDQKLSDLVRRFKSNYPLSQEESAEFGQAVSDRILKLDPSVLLKMSDEQFEDYVGLPAVKKFLPNVLARKAKQRGSQLAGLATDANGTASLGAEQAPAGKPRAETWSQLQKRLAAIAEQVAREPA